MSRTMSKGSNGSKRRTRRACDRCRLKKAKCDGASRCQTCKVNYNSCTYTARRGREARNYYCRMRDVVDEALRQMYWACRRGTGFPGEIPDESTGVVPTNAILLGLGLMVPDPEDSTVLGPRGAISNSGEGDTAHETNGQLINPPAQSDATQEEHPRASRPSLSISPSTYDQMSTTSPSPHSTLMSELELDQSMDTRTLQMQALPQTSLSIPNTMASPLVAPNYSENIAPSIDIDFILDTSCCTVPTSFQLPESLTEATGWEARFSHPRKAYFPEQLNLQEALHDSYLAPWNGTLAAMYQSVPLD